MRIALLADIHGNPIALDAVLADLQAQGGADACWCVGDYAALGYDPVGVLERLTALPDAVFVRGNTDRYTAQSELPSSPVEAAWSDPAHLLALIHMAQSFSWTKGYVTARGWLGWLAALPVEQRSTLPDGARLLMVHAAPGTDDGPGITPATPQGELAALLAGCEADLVVVGHNHWPQDRQAGGVRLINPGSVSNSPARDLRASYALIEATASGYRVAFRRVAYDVQAVIDAVRRSQHPAGDYLLQFFEGRFMPDWLR
ncbi:MAG TPA: metallophosphoesterase family protein [Aggregatilineaceae bacterium]|nr:metallophosphoesterase family protein [Aggregatilineaceae bacterium]